MSEVAGGARVRRRVPRVTLVAGIVAACITLSAVPAAAAPPSQRSAGGTDRGATVRIVAAAADLTAADVTGQTRGAVGRAGDPITVTLVGSGPEGSVLTYSAAQPATGAVELDDDQLTYTPADGISGEQTFGYTVSDGDGNSADGTVRIDVVADRTPSATDGSGTTRGATGRPGDPVTIPVQVADPDGDALTFSVQDPAHGTAAIQPQTGQGTAAPTITYTPDDGFAGTDVFTWSATDSYGGVGTGTVTVVVAANSPPTAPTLTASTRSSISRTGVPVRIALASTDADADPVTYALGTPTGGTAVLDLGGAGPQVVFTPAIGFAGPASVPYTVSDGYGPAVSGSIAVTVTANTAPVASAVTVTVKGSTDRAGDVARADLTAFDPDVPDRNLTYQLLDQPTAVQGTVGLSGAQLTFTPAAGYSGTVLLRYRATDSVGDNATATVSIVVTPNEAPIAPNVAKTTQGSTTVLGTPVVIPLPATDPDGIVSWSASSTTNGLVAVSGSSLTYTPRAGKSGSDTVTYTVTDARGATSSGIVTVTVAPNDKPVGTTSSASTVFGRPVRIPLAATDRQGDTVTFGPAAAPEYASPTYGVDPVTNVPYVLYTPEIPPVLGKFEAGTDTFSYRVTDARGASSITPVTVTVNPNSAPVAAPATAVTRGSTTGVDGIPVDVRLSATDAEGDYPLTFTLGEQPDNGTATMLPSGTGISFTPKAGFVGVETINYLVRDHVVVGGMERPDLEATRPATAKVTVTANRAPSAPLVQLSTTGSTVGAGTPVSATLVSADPEGDTVSFSVEPVAATVGVATVSPTGVFSFTPATGFSGLAFVSYTATDALGANTSGLVIIDVDANSSPTAGTASATTRGGTTLPGAAVLIPLVSVISDADVDDVLTVSVSVPPRNGTATLVGPTTLQYVPRAGFAGVDTITYRVSDGRGGTATSTVGVTVRANRAPTIASQARRIPAGSAVVVNLTGTDPDGDALTYGVGRPPRGTASLSGSGRLLYTAPANFAGTVSVPTAVTDAFGAGGSSTVTYTMYGQSRVTQILAPARPVSTVAPKFTITVAADVGTVSGGVVTIKSDGVLLGTAPVAWNGTVTITSRIKLAKGVRKLAVTFAGTATTSTALANTTMTVY